jgi:EAL domain-containing protein (putative c-di-GMP-specific phosphodiesterase class I)
LSGVRALWLPQRDDLEHALRGEELRIHYQPGVDLRSGRVTGQEALLRWAHPRRGLLAPGAFLKQAEDSGLISPIGTWVLNRACQQAARWTTGQPDRAATVWVNLSGRELAHPQLAATIQGALDAAALPPASLYLEISEDVLLHDAKVRHRLTDLKQLGVRLAVDRFGASYPCVVDLRRLPVDMVKVDRSFVARLPDDGGSNGAVRAIVALADSLGMATTAEGVETSAQLAAVRVLGCDLAQGFRVGQPAPLSSASPRQPG